MMMIRRNELVEAESASRIVAQELDDFAAELPRPRHLFRRLLSLRQRQPTVGQRLIQTGSSGDGGGGGGGNRRGGWVGAEGIGMR